MLSLLMALAGSLAPAWRAIRVDPITATRSD
jgi:ABC-type lipoprotein release transport system permease subunit